MRTRDNQHVTDCCPIRHSLILKHAHSKVRFASARLDKRAEKTAFHSIMNIGVDHGAGDTQAHLKQ